MKEREYTIIACQDEDGGYWTDVPALPGTGSQGDTLEEAIENTKEAITLMRDLGYGRDYKYDHSFPEHHSGQQHLPDALHGRTYYVPTTQGYEAKIAEWLARLRERSTDDRTD